MRTQSNAVVISRYNKSPQAFHEALSAEIARTGQMGHAMMAKLDIKRSTYYAWKSGERPPTREAYDKLLKLFPALQSAAPPPRFAGEPLTEAKAPVEATPPTPPTPPAAEATPEPEAPQPAKFRPPLQPPKPVRPPAPEPEVIHRPARSLPFPSPPPKPSAPVFTIADELPPPALAPLPEPRGERVSPTLSTALRFARTALAVLDMLKEAGLAQDVADLLKEADKAGIALGDVEAMLRPGGID